MDAPVLQIDLGSEVPAYEQILSGLRTHLVTGRFKAGDQLPTVRELALDLGVHHNTVAEAYRLLAVEGWLDLRRGRGATVIYRPLPDPTPEAQAQLAQRLEELVAKGIAEGVPKDVVAQKLDSISQRLQKESSNEA